MHSLRYQIVITNLTQNIQQITYLTPGPKINTEIHTLLIPDGGNPGDNIQIAIKNAQHELHILASLNIPPPPAHYSSRNGIAKVTAKTDRGFILVVDYLRKKGEWKLSRGTISIPEPPNVLKRVAEFVQASYILTVIQDQIDAFQREMNAALTEKWRLEGLLEDARNIVANRERDIGVLRGMLEDERGKLEDNLVRFGS